MKKILQRFRLYSLLFGLILPSLIVAGLMACGGASPPAGIPAPVSQLLSVSNPDASGNVVVSGDDGSVNGGATVTAANVSQGGMVKQLEKIILRTAFAQGGPIEASTVASGTGSFRLTLFANVGDEIQVRQEVNGELSPITTIFVTGNSVALGGTVRDVAVHSSNGMSYVSASDQANNEGLVFGLDFLSGSPLLSFPAPSFNFSNFGGIGQLALNEFDGIGVAISQSEQDVINFPLAGGSIIRDASPAPPISIDILPGDTLAAIGMESTSVSFWIYQSSPTSVFDCGFLLDPKHLRTPFIEMRTDGIFNQILALSEFSDGSWILSRTRFEGCPSFSNNVAVQLPAGTSPGGFASIFNTSAALVSDANSERVFLAEFGIGITDTFTVGANPQGISVNGNRAYVVNGGGNSLSSIDLVDWSVLGPLEGIGLSPTRIGIIGSTNEAVVLSTSDDSAVLADLNLF